MSINNDKTNNEHRSLHFSLSNGKFEVPKVVKLLVGKHEIVAVLKTPVLKGFPPSEEGRFELESEVKFKELVEDVGKETIEYCDSKRCYYQGKMLQGAHVDNEAFGTSVDQKANKRKHLKLEMHIPSVINDGVEVLSKNDLLAASKSLPRGMNMYRYNCRLRSTDKNKNEDKNDALHFNVAYLQLAVHMASCLYDLRSDNPYTPSIIPSLVECLNNICRVTRPINTITKRNKDSIVSSYIRFVLFENSSDPVKVCDLKRTENRIKRALELPGVSRALLHSIHETDDSADVVVKHMPSILRFADKLENEVTKRSCCCSGVPETCSCANCLCECKHELWKLNRQISFNALPPCSRNCLMNRLLRTTVLEKAKNDHLGMRRAISDSNSLNARLNSVSMCLYSLSKSVGPLLRLSDTHVIDRYAWYLKHSLKHGDIYLSPEDISGITESVRDIDGKCRVNSDSLERIVDLFPIFSIFDARKEDNSATKARTTSSWIIRVGSVMHLSYLLTCIPPEDLDKSETKARLASCLIYAMAMGDNPEAVKILIDFGADRSVKVRVRPRVGQLSEDYLVSSYPNRQTSEEKNLELPLTYAYRLGYFSNEECNKSMISLFYDYWPTEKERLTSQLQCKLRMDSLFKYGSKHNRFQRRYRHEEIDEQYLSVWERLYPGLRRALSHGKLERVREIYPPVDAIKSPLLHIHLISHVVQGEDECCTNVVDHLSDLVRGHSPYTIAVSSLQFTVCEALVTRGHDVGEPGLFDLLLESFQIFCSIAKSAVSYRLNTEYPAYSQGYPSAISCLEAASSAQFAVRLRTIDDAKQQLKDLMPEHFYALNLMLFSGLDPTPGPLLPLRKVCNGKHLNNEENSALFNVSDCILIEIVQSSRVLSLIQILLHKFVLLDIENLIEFIQLLLDEALFFTTKELGVESKEIDALVSQANCSRYAAAVAIQSRNSLIVYAILEPNLKVHTFNPNPNPNIDWNQHDSAEELFEVDDS